MVEMGVGNHAKESNLSKNRFVTILLLLLILSLALSAQVFEDSFDSNTLGNYHLTGNVQWNAADSNVSFPGTDQNHELYTRRNFGNTIEMSGKVFIPGSGTGNWDSAALAVYDSLNSQKYWATIAWGTALNERNHMSIMLNDTWGELAPISLLADRWYCLKLATEVSDSGAFIRMKAWDADDAEPADWQLSRTLGLSFKIDGGLGFRHFGNGAVVDDLLVSRDTTIVPFSDYSLLPSPILDDYPTWIELYWKSWEIAASKVQFGTPENGFVDRYLDEAFNSNIFQWDTAFMMFFARYAQGFIPSIVSLDNFYRKQHPDGAICREIRESNGSDFWPKSSRTFTNPPLFSWAEWEYYQYTNDASRFPEVLPVLDRYYQWCKDNRTFASHDLYFWNNLASGMDNSPRPENQVVGWVDYTAQQALAAENLVKIARAIRDSVLAATYQDEYETLSDKLNSLCWNADDGFYWDIDAGVTQVPVKTAACFWPMLAGITDAQQATALVGHLQNPDEFYRPHLFPVLAADHPDYQPEGGYWRGSVWAPTNFMIIKGLQRNGYEQFSREVTANHLDNLYEVFQNTLPNSLWENYSAEFAAPGIHNGIPARPQFVGWTGNGPITLLLENIIGIRAIAPENRLVWRIEETGRHGIENFQFGNNDVDLVCQARTAATDSCQIDIFAAAPFTLDIEWQGDTYQYQAMSGAQQLTVPGGTMVGISERDMVPGKEFLLLENYPNPFNGETRLRMFLPKRGTVSVNIFDVLGRRVHVLKKSGLAAGFNEFPLNFDLQASGVYLYTVNYGAQLRQGKLLYLK